MSRFTRGLSFSILVVAILPVFAACGGDDDGPTGPSTAQIDGAWTYAFSNITGSTGTTNITCSAGNVSIDIDQTGTTFTGSYFAPALTCAGPSGSFTDGPFAGSIVNGSISGTSVSFDFDTSDWRQTGTVSGNSMNGTVTVRFQVDAAQILLSGNWSAARTTNAIVSPRGLRPMTELLEQAAAF